MICPPRKMEKAEHGSAVSTYESAEAFDWLDRRSPIPAVGAMALAAAGKVSHFGAERALAALEEWFRQLFQQEEKTARNSGRLTLYKVLVWRRS